MRLRHRLLRLAEMRGLSPQAALAEMVGSLLRTFVLARLLAPDRSRIAVALGLVVVMAEIIGDVGLDRSIIRLSHEHDLAKQRNTLHSLAVLRCGLLSLGLLAASAPLAIPELALTELEIPFLGRNRLRLTRGRNPLPRNVPRAAG